MCSFTVSVQCLSSHPSRSSSMTLMLHESCHCKSVCRSLFSCQWLCFTVQKSTVSYRSHWEMNEADCAGGAGGIEGPGFTHLSLRKVISVHEATVDNNRVAPQPLTDVVGERCPDAAEPLGTPHRLHIIIIELQLITSVSLAADVSRRNVSHA